MNFAEIKKEKFFPGLLSAEGITPFYCYALVWVRAFSLYKHENEDTKSIAAEARFEDAVFQVYNVNLKGFGHFEKSNETI